jgi:hypothetical protein
MPRDARRLCAHGCGRTKFLQCIVPAKVGILPAVAGEGISQWFSVPWKQLASEKPDGRHLTVILRTTGWSIPVRTVARQAQNRPVGRGANIISPTASCRTSKARWRFAGSAVNACTSPRSCSCTTGKRIGASRQFSRLNPSPNTRWWQAAKGATGGERRFREAIQDRAAGGISPARP